MHGSAQGTFCRLPATALRVERAAPPPAEFRAGDGYVREFCARCGSKLFARNAAYPDLVWIAAGALDDDPGVRPAFHAQVAAGASWHSVTDGLPCYPGPAPEGGP